LEKSNLADLLRRARESAGVRQQRLVALTGIEASRLSRIETGKLEPAKDEVMAILEAIDTDESRALAQTVGQSLDHVQAPTWNILGADDRAALLLVDRAIGKIEGARLPTSLLGHVENLKQSLLGSAAYLTNPHHPIYMVGHVGVGKSTGANSIFNLREGFAKPSRRAKDGSGPERGFLPTGGGGTTAFEFRLGYGPEPSIRIEPQREDKILFEVRELCAFWIAEARGEKRERAVPSEMEKVYRNMAGLIRTSGGDPIQALIHADTDADSLMFEITGRLNLSVRTQTELLYKEDRAADQTEADWLRKRCDALNFGRMPNCPLPRRLEIFLPNPALKVDAFRFTVIDLRGINTTDPRPDLHPDLVNAYSDPRALLVLCSNFLDAPDHCAQSVVEHLKARSAQNVSLLDANRVTLLVLPRADEPESVRRDDSSYVDNRTEGYTLKRKQIGERLGDVADKLAIQFFDARKDEPQPIHDHIMSRVEAIRRSTRDEIAHLDAVVDNLIADVGQAHFKNTQNRVREKISHILDTGKETMDKAATPTPTWLKLVRAIDRFHASSVWSITRGNGEGRSIDLYQIFAEFLREDVKERTTRPTMTLRTLLEELLSHEDMGRAQMRRSKSFVSEIIAMIDRQHEAFLKKCGPLGLSSLKQAFQHDTAFWDECAQLWGQGGGFRAQISNRMEQWFRRHPKITERLDARLQDLWNETFVDWLRSYLVDNADGAGKP
jgi:transcriptional regulator with XRE-family HTH domain